MNIIYINIYNISYFISVFIFLEKKFKNLLFIWNFYVILRCF